MAGSFAVAWLLLLETGLLLVVGGFILNGVGDQTANSVLGWSGMGFVRFTS